MHSCAWMNGQKVGPASQAATQLTCNAVRNQKVGNANNVCQYRNSRVQPPQRAHLNVWDGGNRHMSNWHTSAAPQQAVSFQQPAGRKDNNYLIPLLQNPSTNTQTGNPCVSVTNAFQVPTEHNFHQSPAPNVSFKSPSSTMIANPTYPLQGMPQSWNYPGHGNQSVRTHECYSATNLQSFRKNSYPVNLSSKGEILHASSISQKHQQYTPHLNTADSTGGEATSVNSDLYSRQNEINNFLSKTNETGFNPTADAHEKMLAIATIVGSLQKSSAARSDGHHPLSTSSSYRQQQVVSQVRMVESNQTMQLVASTSTSKSNATHLLPLRSGQHLSKTTQNVMSRTQHFANVPPQQSSIADSFSDTSTVDGSGNKTQADRALSKRSLVESSGDLSRLMQILENVSPQKDMSQSCAANSHEMLEKLSPVKQSDSSIHSSPGLTGTRAIAVVQPLSQESYEVVSKQGSFNAIDQLSECTTTDESLSNPDKLCISPVAKIQKAAYLREGFNVFTENANQMRPNKFAARHSATCSDDTVVSASSSVLHDLLQKQLCAEDSTSELAMSMQAEQQGVTITQQLITSEVPVRQQSNMNQSEMPTGLFSLPRTPWTSVMLSNLIQDEEKKQELDFTKCDSASKILSMFWEGKCKMLADKLKMGWYKDLITSNKEFCEKHVTADSVVLSQVKHDFSHLLKSYHVLKDNELYSEPPYRSSWLNLNTQVDDIDKEFGFPWTLKHAKTMLWSDNEPDQDGMVSSNSSQIVTEVPNKALPQTELEAVDSGEEKQTPAESADSSDPFYTFEIKVLSPVEAKKIFEQVQNKMAQSMEKDIKLAGVVNGSMESELHEVEKVTLRQSKLENKPAPAIDEICCFSKWVEIIAGENAPSLSKCQCKKEQSHKGCTDRSLDKEKTAAQKSLIMSDPKFHSPAKRENQGSNGDNQANGGENNDNMICSLPEISNELIQTIDLTEDNDKPRSYFDKQPKTFSQKIINDNQLSIILISEDDSSSESGIPKQMPDLGITMEDPKEEHAQGKLKSGENRSSNNSENGKEEIKMVFSTEVANQIPDPEECCAQARRTSTDVTASSPESQEEKREAVKRKWKTVSSKDSILPFVKKCTPAVDLDSQPVLKDVNCKKDFVDVPETEPPKTVELMLFGSVPKDGPGSRKRRASSPNAANAAQRPPDVLSVNLSPLRRIAHVPTGAHSVKQRIHEKLRSCPSPSQIKQRSKLKKQKCTFASLSGVSLKKAETSPFTNAMELPVSIKIKMCNKKIKGSLSLRRRRSLCSGRKIRKEKMTYGATCQPAGELRSDSDSGSHTVMPHKENNTLRFKVLPSTFNFKYESSEVRKEITDPLSDTSDLVEKNKSPNQTVLRERGSTWYPNPKKKYCPLPSPPVPKPTSIFQEFQKKYMEKTQPSTDK